MTQVSIRVTESLESLRQWLAALAASFIYRNRLETCSKSAPHTYSWRNPRSKVRSHAPHAKNHDRNGGAKNEPSAGHPKSLLRTKQEIDKRKAKHSLASCKRESCVSSVSRRSACTENAEKTGSWRDARRGGGGARAPKWRVWLYMG